MRIGLFSMLAVLLLCAACAGAERAADGSSAEQQQKNDHALMSTAVEWTMGSDQDRGFVLDNVLHDPIQGDIHFNLWVPENYDGQTPVPLLIALPGWEGLYFQGVGEDLRWEQMPFEARDARPEMIIVSAQLEDWGWKSAEDAIALTRAVLNQYNIDRNRVYLSGYSGGGETGSLVMERAPQLYTAFLIAASQWDGDLRAVAQARTPVYMVVGIRDSYYGSDSLRKAYMELARLYAEAGLTEEEIGQLLVLDVKEDEWFQQRGYQDQHAGAVGFASEREILDWFFSREKEDGKA